MNKNNLISGENIVFKTNRSNWILITQLFYLLIIIVFGMFIFYSVSLKFLVIVKILSPLLFIWVFAFSREILKDSSRIFIFTNKRLISKNDEIAIGKIKNLFVERIFYGRMFKYGNIVIKADKNYVYSGISNPEVIVDLIENERKKVLCFGRSK